MNKKQRESLISESESNLIDSKIRTMSMQLVPAAKSWLAGHYYLVSNIIASYKKNDAFLTLNEKLIELVSFSFQKRSGFGLYIKSLELNDDISHQNMVRGDNYPLLAELIGIEELNNISSKLFEITDIDLLLRKIVSLYDKFMKLIIADLTKFVNDLDITNKVLFVNQDVEEN